MQQAVDVDAYAKPCGTSVCVAVSSGAGHCSHVVLPCGSCCCREREQTMIRAELAGLEEQMKELTSGYRGWITVLGTSTETACIHFAHVAWN